MSAELQILADRIDTLERQARGWKLLVAVAIVLAAAAIGMPLLGFSPAAQTGAPPVAKAGGNARYSTIEANKILLRDTDGQVAGGLEVAGDGTTRLVLGGRYGTKGAAFLQVHGDGIVDLTLRGPDGAVRAALLATQTPMLSLSPNGQRSSATMMTTPDGSGRIQLTDASGRVRFRAP